MDYKLGRVINNNNLNLVDPTLGKFLFLKCYQQISCNRLTSRRRQVVDPLETGMLTVLRQGS